MRGIPESVEPGNILSALQYVFNELLERQTDTQIDFERTHRALRARPADTAPPRDIICCLPNFKLKEETMAKARCNDRITFNDTEISIFQDLSSITLNKRALHPLLEILRRQSIPYKWKFPFALNVTFQGRQLYLRTPNDLQDFCQDPQIPPVDLPDWYQEFCNPPKAHGVQVSPHSTPTKPPNKRYHKQHNPGPSSLPLSTPTLPEHCSLIQAKSEEEKPGGRFTHLQALEPNFTIIN